MSDEPELERIKRELEEVRLKNRQLDAKWALLVDEHRRMLATLITTFDEDQLAEARIALRPLLTKIGRLHGIEPPENWNQD